jgi:hypothetical protein
VSDVVRRGQGDADVDAALARFFEAHIALCP